MVSGMLRPCDLISAPCVAQSTSPPDTQVFLSEMPSSSGKGAQGWVPLTPRRRSPLGCRGGKEAL